jgi:phage terminase large subunit
MLSEINKVAIPSPTASDLIDRGFDPILDRADIVAGIEPKHTWSKPPPKNVLKEINTGYEPRPLQAPLHGALKRFNVIVCHRRWGKTVFSVNELVDRALRNTRENPQYAYIAPTYGQAERIAWMMLKKYTRDIPGIEYNESKLRAVIPRMCAITGKPKDVITIYLLGAESPDSIRGMYFDGVILDEFAEMDPRIWGQVVRPALSDRLGWAIFIGTPKGQNHFYTMYKMALANGERGWYQVIHKASTSGVLPVEELEALKIEQTDEEYEQEMECSFTAALLGSYWGKAMNLATQQARVGNVPHDPALLVDTFWDLGVNDTTTIWFIQQYRQEIRVIDYYEMSGEGLEHYAKALKGQLPDTEHNQHSHRKNYTYRYTNWPHDGGARNLGEKAEKRDTIMGGLGFRPKVHERYNVADGIEAGRRLIAKAYFDAKRCERGIDALKNYQREYDAKNKIFRDTPLHNWASNGADAWRLAGMALRPGEDRLADKNSLPRQCDNDYDMFGG